jgi:hypothetical protein
MTPQIELRSDLNAEDDDGQNWTLIENTTNPAGVHVGAVLVAGMPRFWSVIRITAVDPDGRVHFVQLDESDPAARELLATVA